MKAKCNRKLVVSIIEDTKSAQFRYRVKNVAESVACGSDWQMKWFSKTELEKARKLLQKASLLVIERQMAKDDTLIKFIEEAHTIGMKVLFDLDDLVFDYRKMLLLMKSTNSKNVFYWAGYFWGIRRIAKRVDGFICTNDYLARGLKRSFNKPVQVVRNSLNREQIEASDKIVKKKIKREKKFVVGYFSGSPTHVKDFRMVEPALVKFLKMHDDVMLKVVGDMDFSNEMKTWVERGRVEKSEKVDFLELQRLIAEVDINIAPLLINDFTNCKSELKFFEAAIVETTTIASPTYTFKRAISDGKNGFLAYPGEWYDKLEYLYKHPRENRKIALEAKKYTMKHYYGKEFLKEVEAAYDYFTK